MSFDNYYFGSGFTTGTALGVLSGVLIIFLLLIIALEVVCYVFQSLGLYTIAKRRGIKGYGWAWVPVGNAWIMGSLADQYDRKDKGKDIPTRIYILIGGIAAVVLSIFYLVILIPWTVVVSTGYVSDSAAAISGIGGFLVIAFLFWVVSIAYSVFVYIAMYKTLKSCSPGNAVALLVLSIIFGVVFPFAIFAVRNKDEGFIELEQKDRQNGGDQQAF